MRSWLGVLLGSLLLGACTSTADISEQPCPPIGTLLTYQNFGVGFMNSYCQSCHGSQSANRAGAPSDVTFGTLDQVHQHRVRIYARAAGSNDSMPPGTTAPTQAERDNLAEWLSCGAP